MRCRSKLKGKGTVDKNRRRLHKILIGIFNIIAMIIDVVLILAFVILISIALLLLLAIIFRSIDICKEYVNFINAKFVPTNLPDNTKGVDSLIATFGVFASIAVIPVISFIGSLFVSNKAKSEQVDEQFSKFKNLSLYLNSLPYGTWSNQVLNYKNGKHSNSNVLKPLLDYDYCLCLLFNNDCFQSYEVKVAWVEYIKDGENISVFDDEIPYFISDTSGMSDGEHKESTTLLSLLLELEDADVEEEKQIKSNFVEHLFNEKETKQINLFVTLQPREYTAEELLSNLCKAKFAYAFPLIRSFYRKVVRNMQEGKCHKIELSLGASLKNINEENIKFKFEILDINIETKRRFKNSLSSR